MFRLFLYLNSLAAGYVLFSVLLQILSVMMFVFSIIGIIATIKFFAGRRKKKETAEEKWLRTGKL